MIKLEALGFDRTIINIKRDDGTLTETEIAQNIWDCLGDIMIQAMIDEKLGSTAVKKYDIFMKGWNCFRPRYYTVKGLLKIFIKMNRKGWNIFMDKNSVFYMKCPAFDVWHRQRNSQTHTVHADSSLYVHPIDSQIIKFLDMPGVKSVFNSAVDMMADLNFSQIISSGIATDENNFPEINDIVNHCVSVLGIKKPYVVISGEINMNAFTSGSDEKPYIVLSNSLVKNMGHKKMCFIIGHECGHISMEHVLYHTIVNVASELFNIVPFVGSMLYKSSVLPLAAWSRRSEITADRAGLLCCGDIDEACRALLQLQSGFISSKKIDMDSYVRNSRKYRRKGTLKRLGEFLMTHPPLPKRIEALKLFAQSEPYFTARGIQPPANCLTKKELTHSVEDILAVLGGK